MLAFSQLAGLIVAGFPATPLCRRGFCRGCALAAGILLGICLRRAGWQDLRRIARDHAADCAGYCSGFARGAGGMRDLRRIARDHAADCAGSCGRLRGILRRIARDFCRDVAECRRMSPNVGEMLEMLKMLKMLSGNVENVENVVARLGFRP